MSAPLDILQQAYSVNENRMLARPFSAKAVVSVDVSEGEYRVIGDITLPPKDNVDQKGYTKRADPKDVMSARFWLINDPDPEVYAQVERHLQWLPYPGATKTVGTKLFFNLNGQNLNGTITIVKVVKEIVTETEAASATERVEDIALLFPDVTPAQYDLWTADDDLYHLVLDFNASSQYAVNFFTNGSYSIFTPIVEQLRTRLRRPAKIHILVKTANIAYAIQEFNRDLELVRNADPVKKWWPNGKIIIQKGQYLEKDARPWYAARAQMKFASLEQYFTAFFYGTIIEDEASQGVSQSYYGKIRFVPIPGSQDIAYFGFLELFHENFRLTPGDYCGNTECE